ERQPHGRLERLAGPGCDDACARVLGGGERSLGRLLLHQFKRLAVRWERRLDLHDALVPLACGLICWRRLKNRTP
ncbi:hypothetical protein K9U14_33485, partial [Streptomyces griseocarneus]|nr:hypothetical protein [Streptomyces griseocarneus]